MTPAGRTCCTRPPMKRGRHTTDTAAPARTAARDAGVNLAFFSGNEVYWRTRWEPSIDSSHSPYRTLVCYKETHDRFDDHTEFISQQGVKTDPNKAEWTGTYRDASPANPQGP